MELENSQNYKNYTQAVSEILEAYYAHSLRPIPANMSSIVVHWTNLLIKCGVPMLQLMDIYLEAHMTLKSGEYFNIDRIIAVWNERKEIQIQKNQKSVCTVCNGLKHTKKYDFKLKEDVSIPCPSC